MKPHRTPVLLALEAMDDIGNEDLDRGGAYGAAGDGTRTNGSISAQPALAALPALPALPALAAKVCELRIRLTFLRDGEEHPCPLMLRTSGTSH
ncbi:hypothetical protein [Streptomyces chattanoogensis]|uniref:hypothetical protein n=1 Tax=Streptomyces chattanoogensis TaxID=66876 RepID=UPI0036A21900